MTPKLVIAAAVMDHSGAIFIGSFHGAAINRAILGGAVKIPDYVDESWDVAFFVGFVDNTGGFLTREEAFHLGKQSGQLPADLEGAWNDPDGCVHAGDFRGGD